MFIYLEIYCHVPEDIENGRVDYIENKGKIPYNGTARYRCKEGFYLSGNPVIRCAAWQTWDYAPPICEFRAIEITSSTRSHPHIESWRQTNGICLNNFFYIKTVFQCAFFFFFLEKRGVIETLVSWPRKL